MFSLALTQTPPQGEEGGEGNVSGCECCRIGEGYGVCACMHACACMHVHMCACVCLHVYICAQCLLELMMSETTA